MKIKLLALCAFLSVVSASAQQKFSSLPIGANLDGYISSIQILVAGDGLDFSAWQSYPYNCKHDGKLEAFAVQKLRDYTASIKFVNGTTYGWEIHAVTDGIGGLLPSYNGKAASAVIASAPPTGEPQEFHPTLRNGKWEVPEDIFGKVKFGWGIAVPFHIQTLWNLRITLYDNQGRVSRFSAQERVADNDNPCELPSVLGGLSVNDAYIPREVALANNAWWTRAEIELLTINNEQSVTFLVNRTTDDGKAIRWSNPPPSFFVPPMPKIARIARVGNTTEITVSAEETSVAYLEFAKTLSGNWNALPAYQVPLTLQTGSSTFTHTTDALSCFYRLRVISSSPQ